MPTVNHKRVNYVYSCKWWLLQYTLLSAQSNAFCLYEASDARCSPLFSPNSQ